MQHLFSSKKVLSFLTLILFSIQIFGFSIENTFALNTLYYVDATAGSDSNDGLSSGSAWKTLTRVSSETFSPGDQIFLKCGETWTDTLTLDGADSDIIISSYGACSTLGRPKITSSGTVNSFIKIANASYVSIMGLDISGTATYAIDLTDAGTGITIERSIIKSSGSGIIYAPNGAGFTLVNNLLTTTDTGTTIIHVANGSRANIFDNTLVGGYESILLDNTAGNILANNTFYNPYASALVVRETTSAPPGQVTDNIFSSNTLLTWNPSFPMVHLENQNGGTGSLIALVSNTYVNVYKPTLPLVDFVSSGSVTQTFSKDTIINIDQGPTTFTNFAYSSYNGNETRLLLNTGASIVNKPCPGGICPQYVGTDNVSITWPMSMAGYSSKIILWNNAPNTIFPPSCTLDPSPTSIPNGGSTTLTWTTNNASSGVMLTEPTAGGESITNSVSNNGSGTYYPPIDDQVNHYILTATNTVGSKTCLADITAQNSPPVLVEFFLTGSEDASSITGTLEATDSTGDTIYFEKFTDPISGTMTLDPETGDVAYTPNPNFCGTDTFQWRAFDQNNRYSDASNGVITVTCSNDAPVSVDDVFAATGGTSILLDVAQNDIDADTPYEPQVFTLSGVSLPMHGTLVLSGTQFEYLADFAYLGSDSFLYVVLDQSGAVSNTGTVNINVTPGANIAPVGASGSYVLDEDTSITHDLTGSDANGDALSFSASTLPIHGTLSIVSSGFTYTPDANYNGVDSFAYIVSDGEDNSSPSTISLTIDPIADTPIAALDTPMVEMNTPTDIDVLANDTDADTPYQPQTLTITGLTSPSSGTASVLAGKVRYIPNPSYTGSDSFDYAIVDQDGNLSNTVTVSITVSTDNQYPLADAGAFTTPEDTELAATLSGSDPDGLPVSFVLNGDVSHGTLILSSTGGFTYTPDANYHGSDSFSFHVTDSVLSSGPQTVTITVDSLNDVPVAVADTFNMSEDSFLDTTPLANDTDVDVGDVLTLVSSTAGLHGMTTLSGNTIHYSPVTDFCGADSFTYTIQDQAGGVSSSGTVTMNIACINDAPIASGALYSMTGNIITSSGYTLSSSLVGIDADIGDVLTYAIDQNVSHGILTLTGKNFVYIPTLGYTGSDMFTYVVSDGASTSLTGSISIDITTNTYNFVPLAYTGSYTGSEDTSIVGTLSGYDLETSNLTFVTNSGVSHGTFVLSSTGGFTYAPDANYHGSDSFSFSVLDSAGVSSNTTIVNLTIISVNDAPTAGDDTVSGTEDIDLTIIPLTNDTDIDGDALSLDTYTQGSHGSVIASGNTLIYTPVRDYCGADTFTYRARDTTPLASNTATVHLSLACTNDAPTSIADNIGATEDMPLFIPVLANDTDIDGDTLSMASITQPISGGSTAISATGIIFTPTPNLCTSSPITFTYYARDTSNALSTPATVTVSNISCVNDAPTGTSQSYSLSGNIVISSGTVLSGGTLSGYVASNNVFSRTLTATDIDSPSLTYVIGTLPTHGTVSLTASGVLTYTPTVGYVGTDSFTYIVSDGILSSSPVNVSLSIVDPRTPVIPVEGPGGGGGSASPAYSITNLYTTATSMAAVSTGLTSQLYIASPNLSSKKNTTVTLLKEYSELIAPVVTNVKESQIDTMSRSERATTIRQAGQKLIHTLRKSIVLSNEQKSSILEGAEEELSELQDTTIPSRESRALSYVLRIIRQEKIKIQQGSEVVKYLLSI